VKLCLSIQLPPGKSRWAASSSSSLLRHVTQDGLWALCGIEIRPASPTHLSLACSLCMELAFTGADRREQGAAS
jgi:hypothetical protein